MPGERNPDGVLPLYEPEGLRLGIDTSGRGFYGAEPVPDMGGSLPRPSLAGPSAVPVRAKGMGGSERPSPEKQAQRALTPDELMMLANQMEAQVQFTPGPTAVEPTLERDTNVPYWLRNYAEKEGL